MISKIVPILKKATDEMAFSLWLTFDDPSRTMFIEDIHMMAKRLGGPIFAPHLTILGDLQTSQ